VFFFPPKRLNGSGTFTPLYAMGGGILYGVKAAGNEWSYTSTPPTRLHSLLSNGDSFFKKKNGWSQKLNTDLRLVTRVSMNGIKPPLPHTPSWRA
jgi:hypothetical protein